MRVKFFYVFCFLLLAGCLTACQGEKLPADAAEPSPTKGTPSPTEGLAVSPTEAVLSPSLTPIAPGTLPEVDSLPKADDSAVGTRCKLNLMDIDRLSFAYYYDAESGRERLVVAPIPPDETKLFNGQIFVLPPAAGPLTVYETALGGAEGLRTALNGEIEGTVLAVVNISFQEIFAAYSESSRCDKETDSVKQFKLEAGGENSGSLGRYFGASDEKPDADNEALWQQLSNGQYIMLWEVVKEENYQNPNTPNVDEVFRSIYERFGLTELVMGTK